MPWAKDRARPQCTASRPSPSGSGARSAHSCSAAANHRWQGSASVETGGCDGCEIEPLDARAGRCAASSGGGADQKPHATARRDVDQGRKGKCGRRALLRRLCPAPASGVDGPADARRSRRATTRRIARLVGRAAGHGPRRRLCTPQDHRGHRARRARHPPNSCLLSSISCRRSMRRQRRSRDGAGRG